MEFSSAAGEKCLEGDICRDGEVSYLSFMVAMAKVAVLIGVN